MAGGGIKPADHDFNDQRNRKTGRQTGREDTVRESREKREDTRTHRDRQAEAETALLTGLVQI